MTIFYNSSLDGARRVLLSSTGVGTLRVSSPKVLVSVRGLSVPEGSRRYLLSSVVEGSGLYLLWSVPGGSYCPEASVVGTWRFDCVRRLCGWSSRCRYLRMCGWKNADIFGFNKSNREIRNWSNISQRTHLHYSTVRTE